MKKKIGCIVPAVILLLVGFCLYMEYNFSHYKFTEPNLTNEEILQEMPEIVISEEELKMGKEVLALPEVQEVIKQSEAEGDDMTFLSEKETKRLLAKYAEKGQPAGELLVIEGRIHFVFDVTEEKELAIAFALLMKNRQKSLFLYGRKTGKARKM